MSVEDLSSVCKVDAFCFSSPLAMVLEAFCALLEFSREELIQNSCSWRADERIEFKCNRCKKLANLLKKAITAWRPNDHYIYR